MRLSKEFILIVVFFMLTSTGKSQKNTLRYTQFWNEFAFTRPLKGNWALEFNFGQTWTSPIGGNDFFYTNAQLYARVWVHYFLNPRWKLSYFYAYFSNKDVPEINQRKARELRSAIQAIYYIKKASTYTLTTRMKIEDRHILNKAGVYEAVYRFRDQLRIVVPLNSKYIRQGVIYGIASDELSFKTASEVTGPTFFDRNRFSIGAGYSVTDDMQIELTYADEYLPRTTNDELYNGIQLNVNFNNLLTNIKNKLIKRRKQ